MTAVAGQRPRLLSRTYLQVALAAVFINTSYGTLSYAFSVLVTDDAAGGAFGRDVVSVGFGLALLVSGVASIATGTVSDLFGSRRLMAGGAVLGAAGLALFAAVQEPWQAVLVLAVVLGPAMAATFYEPVYVLMNRWFAAPDRPRAYGVLTLLSGVSVTIFTPLTRLFVDQFGWREGTLGLAAILLVVGIAVPLLLWEPTDGHAHQRGLRGNLLRETREGVRQTTPRFWLFSVAFFVATAAFSGFAFHMIAQLETRGFAPGPVAVAIAVTGIVSLPMRLLLPSLSARFSGTALLTGCLLLLALSAWIASVAGEWWQVWVYVAVFGAVFGAVYPLRALVVSEGFSGPYFGRVIGLQALLVAFGRAAGPALLGIFATGRASYALGFQVSALVLALSAVVMWASMRNGGANVATEADSARSPR
ncbi:MAG: MFS transporter [Dehalococcoidia bacterium]|nr:MFS transporter [Dehalococcoidia bacterium]